MSIKRVASQIMDGAHPNIVQDQELVGVIANLMTTKTKLRLSRSESTLIPRIDSALEALSERATPKKAVHLKNRSSFVIKSREFTDAVAWLREHMGESELTVETVEQKRQLTRSLRKLKAVELQNRAYDKLEKLDAFENTLKGTVTEEEKQAMKIYTAIEEDRIETAVKAMNDAIVDWNMVLQEQRKARNEQQAIMEEEFEEEITAATNQLKSEKREVKHTKKYHELRKDEYYAARGGDYKGAKKFQQMAEELEKEEEAVHEREYIEYCHNKMERLIAAQDKKRAAFVGRWEAYSAATLASMEKDMETKKKSIELAKKKYKDKVRK